MTQTPYLHAVIITHEIAENATCEMEMQTFFNLSESTLFCGGGIKNSNYMFMWNAVLLH